MIRKYPWYFVFLIFVILCLVNIFQKMQWNEPTDNIAWEASEEGLVCVDAPEDSPIKKNDILLTIRKYVIKNKIDLQRAITQKRYCLYEIERGGILKIVGIDISTRYTPLSYYILVFSGILMILLCLRIININLKEKKKFSPSSNFYFLVLTFSGFLIFSPTGAYNTPDFVYLFLDTVSFLFFPALLLHYSLYYPVRSLILRKINPKFLKYCIYAVPSAILALDIFFLIGSITHLDTDSLLRSINHFRDISLRYFALYLYISLIFFLISNLTLIFYKKEKRFILPLAGITISMASLLVFNFVLNVPGLYLNLSLLMLVFMPLTLTYYLGHRKFTDIEDVIKKTIGVTFIFPFIFGIYFFLGSTIEQNKLLGIFWSLTAILTAGLLYKPIEKTAHLYFEKLFFRSTFNFKRKLKELTESLPTERDLHSLCTSFINTINRGFLLERSTFILHQRKNVFYALPQKDKIILSRGFRHQLFNSTYLAFYSAADFKTRYPKDYEVLKGMNYSQFLPLKTPDRLIGVLAIGIKEDGTYLSVEDWELLLNLSSSLSLSVENASLYSELKNQFEEIRLLKEFNENIIENINMGIVVLTGLNIIKTWNNIMELKFKIPAEEAINKKAHAIFGIEVWKKIYRQKEEISTLSNVTIEIQGDESIFDIYISPLKDSMGRRMGTILAFEDMTEKIFIRNQLVTSEKMASLGLLSAGIAHEVNTPLTGISSYCQIILDNPQDPENIELISLIQEQVQRANKIIRSLLDFSRQKGERPMEVDLNLVINGSIALVEHKLKERKIQLKREFQFKYKLYGFSSRLQQMFINLLLNAIDAITHNDGQISISGLETDSELSVRIKDNGKGIDTNYLDKIFDPFFTTKEEGKGTGLGLSIVYAIVEEHYGEIKAASKIDRGSTFTISFPIANPLRSIKP
ncbi:MAG TPA: ATP-binding protein [Candidatus Deferrimicrobium sp.]|nr:ATP-binding protein [Candidatus Deferrimicrobium sp.]